MLGEIIHQEENIVQVRFRESDSVKKFLYPESFETFLSICNTDLIPEVEEALYKTQLQKIEARCIETERREALGADLQKERQAKAVSQCGAARNYAKHSLCFHKGCGFAVARRKNH